MRILRIGIENLNSLRGEHLIDFTVPPLSDNPLYAIVGATGAGKTTILDAITLAIFGLTERNRDHTDAKREVATVMTHGTATCRAEVEFATGGHRYRSVWRRRRAHNKAVNNLLATEREFSRYDPVTETYEILATKKREIDEQTVAVLGLDYDRFVRSVMLTQGAFDRFLKSRPDEKAEILEQITGTELYRDLSEAAFLRAKETREAHRKVSDSLAHDPPLAEEVREGLDRDLAQGRAAVDTLKEEQARLLRDLGRHEARERAEAELGQASAQHARAREAWEALAAERRRLVASEGLEAFRADLLAEENLRASLIAAREGLTRLVKESNEAEQHLVDARAITNALREALSVFVDAQPQRDHLLEEAERIENRLDLLRQDHRRAAAQQASHLRTRTEQESELQSAQASVDQLEKELSGYSPEVLEEQLAGLERTVPECSQRLTDLRERMVQRKRQDRLSLLHQQLETKRSARDTARLTWEAAHAIMKTEEGRVKLVEVQIQNARLRASLVTHRRQLSNGDPCPLCGSTHHPLLAEAAAGEDEMETLNRALTEASNALTAAEIRETADAKTFADADRQVHELVAKTEELTGEVSEPEPLSVEELTAASREAGERYTEQQARLEELRALRTKLPQLEGARVTAARRSADLLTTQQQAEEVATELTQLDSRILADGEALTQLLGPDRGSRQCRNAWQLEERELRRKLSDQEKAEQLLTTEVARLTERLTVLREQERQQAEQQGELTVRLTEGLSPTGYTAERARAALLDASEAVALRATRTRADQELGTARTLEKQQSAQVERLRAEAIELPPVEELRAAARQGEERISQREQEVGRLLLRREQDDENRNRQVELTERLAGLSAERDRWDRLNELIGSADGKKFRGYAQSLTLRRLVDMGNRHLATINPRYRMAYAPPLPGGKEELELEIVDTYMNDNRRLMSTLSGGESFLISLALALGLSDLASGQLSIQSLFIDEGFGTLDGKTLDQAMVTLEQLRAQGKTIGIISHVPQLRERVVCQIRVKPQGNGFSRIELAS